MKSCVKLDKKRISHSSTDILLKLALLKISASPQHTFARHAICPCVGNVKRVNSILIFNAHSIRQVLILNKINNQVTEARLVISALKWRVDPATFGKRRPQTQ